jgi:hypothetical protein
MSIKLAHMKQKKACVLKGKVDVSWVKKRRDLFENEEAK